MRMPSRIGESNRRAVQMSNAGFDESAATSAGRQPGCLNQTRSLSAQDVARHESLASSA
jgi:hypothetical protein